MRLVFAGSPDFAVPSLRCLHQAGHHVALVVTRPDRPRGRSGKPRPTAVKRGAERLGLAVYQPEDANAPDAVERLRAADAELGVVVAFGAILQPQVLATTERGLINLHASLLPDYRGAAPINWAIIRGEELTGVSVIRMSPRLDAGPVLAERKVRIDPEETAGQLHDRLAEVGASAVVDVVNRMDAGEKIEQRPQPQQGGFFARKLTKADGKIDWHLPAQTIHDRVRGLLPWPGAFCLYQGGDGNIRVNLTEVRVAESTGKGRPGEVVAVDNGERIVVQAGGEGRVEIVRLKPAGSRDMAARDFVHGYHVRPGYRFE